MAIIKKIALLSLFLSAACSSEIGQDLGNGSSADAGPDPISDPPQVCDEAVALTFEQRQVVPDIMVVLDKSGSMGDRLVSGNSTSKWDVMRSAMATVVGGQGDKVNFGLLMYPWKDGCRDGQVRVAPAVNNIGNILGEMNSVGPDGKTPTHQAIRKAREYYDANPVNPDGQVVILATDGMPVCSSIGQSVDEIEKLAQQDIKTYVLGFGFGDANTSGLQSMAVAGGTGQLYSADSPDELSLALDTILGEVTIPSCEFTLQEQPENDADINVELAGQELERNGADGFSYDSASNTITLLGASCESVKSGTAAAIDVDLGCEGAIIE